MGHFSTLGEHDLKDPENTRESIADFGKVEVFDYDTETEKFNLRWKDDLSFFDDSKWEKADGFGLPDISTIFDADNVFFERGMLKLKLDCANCADD